MFKAVINGHVGYSRHSPKLALHAARHYCDRAHTSKLHTLLGKHACEACGKLCDLDSLAPINGEGSDTLLCHVCGVKAGLDAWDYPCLRQPCEVCREPHAHQELGPMGLCDECTHQMVAEYGHDSI